MMYLPVDKKRNEGSIKKASVHLIKKIISGGQTGADRAALDFAIQHGIPHGGWIPKGRKTEDGTLNGKYQLQEMPTAEYSKRTEKNIMDSDGTWIVSHGELSGGSALTMKLAERHGRPWTHTDLGNISLVQAAAVVQDWLATNHIEVLNIAGPRLSKDPEIYQATMKLLELTFA